MNSLSRLTRVLVARNAIGNQIAKRNGKCLVMQQTSNLSSKKQGNFTEPTNNDSKSKPKVKLYPGYQESIEDKYLNQSTSSSSDTDSGMYII